MVKRTCYILTSMSISKDLDRRAKDNCSWGLMLLSRQPTQYALRTVGAFFAPYAAHLHLLVLTVIPTLYPAGRYRAQSSLVPSREQRALGEETLRTARATLEHDGLALAQIETLIRVGSPADELAAVAGKRHVDCIVIGSRGNSPGTAVPAVAFWQHFAPCRQTCTVPCSGGDSTAIPRPQGSGRLV